MSERSAALRGDADSRRAAIAAIADAPAASIDGDDLRALVDCLGFAQKSVQRPAADACAALHAGGAPVRALLVDALASTDVRLRWGATYALGRADAEAREVLPVALEALGSDDGDVRWAAAAMVQNLARLDRKVTADLLGAVRGEPAAKRKMALYCLRDLGARGEDFCRAAVAALGDADEGVALAALSTVSRLAPDDEAAIAATTALLASPNLGVARAAALALSLVGRGRVEVDESLRRATESDDESLRRAALAALARRDG